MVQVFPSPQHILVVLLHSNAPAFLPGPCPVRPGLRLGCFYVSAVTSPDPRVSCSRLMSFGSPGPRTASLTPRVCLPPRRGWVWRACRSDPRVAWRQVSPPPPVYLGTCIQLTFRVIPSFGSFPSGTDLPPEDTVGATVCGLPQV